MKSSKLLLIAGVVILLAAFGIYVIVAGQGNGEVVSEGAGTSCPANNNLAEKVAPAFIGDVAALRPIEVAVDLSGLKFANRDGEDQVLGDWRGKTVLLNLWATWCAPCREEMPALDTLEAELGGKKFSVVPISIDLDSPEKAAAFYAEIGIEKLPFFHEGELEIFNRLKKQGLAFGMPTTLLVDEKSCAIAVMNGPAHWAGRDALALIETTIEAQNRE